MESLDSPDHKTPSITSGDLKLVCSLCGHALGLEENNYIVPCSTMPLSKIHLASLWYGNLENAVDTTGVLIMVSDIKSVDTRVWKTSPEHGMWSKEDGCVFKKIICSFCKNEENCLGFHVVATDSSNSQLLNKALFMSDRLGIQHIDVSRNKELSPSSTVTSETKSPVQDSYVSDFN
ncbi:uncharacterized protein LOC143538306 [Bidens hawaiensis]|uniref:uncharacterized protein LOC143538306 n=1 Tax=Bidens hawaiensis TaxID=980011 RepID=UPI00404A811A